MRGLGAFGLLLFASTTFAAPWAFDPPIVVSHDAGPQAYTHLESAGRKSIAESAAWVAVTWEDNRDGVSRCYVALKAPGKNAFGKALRVSGAGEAYESVVVGLAQGRFALAWEEGGRVHARLLLHGALGQPITLGSHAALQVSLGYAAPDALFATWSEKPKQYWQIQVARLLPGRDATLKAASPYAIETAALEGDQSYPSVVALSAKQLVVAWEDRRAGHTRILSSTSTTGGVRFTPPQQINDAVWRGQMNGFGRGTGVMRVALSPYAAKGVAAVWADKRDFLSGYDVYVALMPDAKRKFGANEKAQDDFGNAIAQWHPVIGSNRQGQVVVVWDDDRDGTPDIWLSWRNASGWSGDLAVPGASGAGVQSDPALVLDAAGDLHVAWVEKAELNSPSHIRYVRGRLQDVREKP